MQVVEEEVRRLLSGRAELWELVMTGGLWRVSGKEVREAAEGSSFQFLPHPSLHHLLSSSLAEVLWQSWQL